MANILDDKDQPQRLGGEPRHHEEDRRTSDSIAPRDTRILERIEKAEKTLKDAIEEAKLHLREQIEKTTEKQEQKENAAQDRLVRAQQQIDQAIRKIADDVAQAIRVAVAEILRNIDGLLRAMLAGIPDRLTQITQQIEQVNRNVLLTNDNLASVAAGFRQFQADIAEVKGHLIGAINAANQAAIMAREIVGAKAEIVASLIRVESNVSKQYSDLLTLLGRIHERMSVLSDIQNTSKTLSLELGKISELRNITQDALKRFERASGDMQRDIRDMRTSTVDYVVRIHERQADITRELVTIGSTLADLRAQINTLVNVVDAIKRQI